jgi:hypothetical protein
MPSTATSTQSTSSPAHKDFHWIHGPGRDNPLADFVELTHDIATGINSCLQMIYASDLSREINLDLEPDQQCKPAIGKTDAANLLRLSLAASHLLGKASEQQIAQLNRARPA